MKDGDVRCTRTKMTAINFDRLSELAKGKKYAIPVQVEKIVGYAPNTKNSDRIIVRESHRIIIHKNPRSSTIRKMQMQTI